MVSDGSTSNVMVFPVKDFTKICGFLLDVVVGQSAPILQLLSYKGQTLLLDGWEIYPDTTTTSYECRPVRLSSMFVSDTLLLTL
jgi:hypothetical protein